MLRAPCVAQIANLPRRRLAVGRAAVCSDDSLFSRASRITNPRYSRLPACATEAEAAVAGMAAQTSRERGASLRAKVRRPTGGAMLRAPAVAQIANLPRRRLAVGRASVGLSDSLFSRGWRISNPRHSRLPACATKAVATIARAAAQTSWERGASLRAKVRRPTGGAMLRAPCVAQIANLPRRRLAVGRAAVCSDDSLFSRASRIGNPRYGRLTACATTNAGWRIRR
jgi:hypothetical protein